MGTPIGVHNNYGDRRIPSEKYPMVEMEQNILINASFLPSENLANLVKGLSENQALFYNDEPLAFFSTEGTRNRL